VRSAKGENVRFAFFAITAALAAACTSNTVVNTGESPHTEGPVATSTSAGRIDPNLVDAHDYYIVAEGIKGYYFTTPSGKWNCAIIPHSKVGCQTGAGQGMGIPGQPATIQTSGGDTVAPNAIAVSDEGEPGFIWVDRPGFGLTSGKPVALDFNKTLAAAGFRCNVQQSSGVSCQNELTHKGFTFSADGFVLQYTPVPG
jgi:hypothetical protein